MSIATTLQNGKAHRTHASEIPFHQYVAQAAGAFAQLVRAVRRLEEPVQPAAYEACWTLIDQEMAQLLTAEGIREELEQFLTQTRIA
jgi:hypothetical protein